MDGRSSLGGGRYDFTFCCAQKLCTGREVQLQPAPPFSGIHRHQIQYYFYIPTHTMPSKGHSHIPATYVLQLPLQLLAQPINISYYFEKNIIFSLPSFFTFMVYKKEEIKSEIDLKDSNKLQFPFTLHILHARHIVECHTLKHIRIKSVGKDRSFG